jgi:hypothetical protein
MKKTLAEFMLEDGQALRSIYNYLQLSYEQIEGKTLEFDEYAYTNELQFYKTVQEAVRILIEHTAENNENANY